jgi:ascorbate-specific PTS system EIIC-type component UlaA
MVEEVARLTAQYLAATFGWVWNWVVLGLLWLGVGGFIFLPVLLRLANWCTQRWIIWPTLVVVAWLYAHLWVASLVWFDINVAGVSASYVHSNVWAAVTVFVLLSILGTGLTWKWWSR